MKAIRKVLWLYRAPEINRVFFWYLFIFTWYILRKWPYIVETIHSRNHKKELSKMYIIHLCIYIFYRAVKRLIKNQYGVVFSIQVKNGLSSTWWLGPDWKGEERPIGRKEKKKKWNPRRKGILRERKQYTLSAVERLSDI